MNEFCRLSGLDTALLVGLIQGATKSAINIVYNWGQTVKGVYKERAEIILCHSQIHHLLDLELDKNNVALILELIQVLPEVTVSTSDYLHAVSSFCKEHNLLLIIDETLTGSGRTGTLFIHEKVGIRPDLLLLGNAL